MKRSIAVILSLAFLAGSYAFAFGVPKSVALIFSSAPVENAAPSRGENTGPRGQGRATAVVLTSLEESQYTLTLRAVGSAVSLRRADVVATEAGEVVETTLHANTLVERGDVILRLDDRTERLSLEIAQANRDQAQATVTRYEGLHNTGSTVVTDVALSEAEVALRLAEANVGLAEVALDNRTIVAPISGRLGLSDVNVGDRLSNDDVIVTIDDATTLLAEFEVPERSIGLLMEGKAVSVSTPTYAGRVFEGTITAFDSRLDSITRSATVQAEIDNVDGLLLSGMTFAVRMLEETDPLPVLPSTAITWDRTGAGIWVAVDGTTRRVPVTIRYRDGDRVWIETDTPVGSQIVTEGASKLRDGSQITTAQTGEGA
ncbi:efflux RND transporter periplasmic adaptor subunit [Loktanella sp. D2R18]|uniref:efflux RND transporter periplasmic adaptor subunit n=1 Tax=Rhodobacterales TaxID=204455 RepID=UPI000DEA9A38|nr:MULTISPECIES: efflux RND transporter periplasmic adaptor subunit [Rhodobacterales]MDO6592111.1 efflux RND transporter periplasmic adaptor subunit [Yoonia sp. 1_MG-2023]RBW42731.1 efflux RND transporter periplasmic adaptor subunit [Loktanella sp. D2R18]